MFQIPDAILNYWQIKNKPKATIMDIARIKGEIHFPLSASYIEFVTLYGFVVFGEDEEHRYHFDYEVDFPNRKEIREGNIAFLHKPDQIIMAYNNMTTAEYEDDETLPAIPPTIFPLATIWGRARFLWNLAKMPAVSGTGQRGNGLGGQKAILG